MTIVYRTDGAQINNAPMDENFEQLSQRYEGSDISSSATLSLTSGYTYFTVSGNTDITAIDGVHIGQRIALRFTEAGGAIGHATALVMPTNDDAISWRAGDTAIFVNSATGVWTCVSYQRGDISPMGAVTQTDGDNSTNAASTEYVDGKTAGAGSNKKWEHHATFNSTGQTLGETTTIPSDVVAVRVLIQGLGVAVTDLTWIVGIEMSDSATYPTTAWTQGQAQARSNLTADWVKSGRFHISNAGGSADATYASVEYWNLQGTDIWIGGGYGWEEDDTDFYGAFGRVELSGTLDRLRIKVDDGSANEDIDAGSAEIWVLR